MVRLLGWCVWKSLVRLWGNGYRCGVAGLGISWMQRYSLLSGTGSSSHMGSSSTAIGRSSFSSSESAADASGGVSSKHASHSVFEEKKTQKNAHLQKKKKKTLFKQKKHLLDTQKSIFKEINTYISAIIILLLNSVVLYNFSFIT